MSANVLKFPVSGGEERKPAPLRPPPVYETFDRERTGELLGVARTTLSTTETLLDFVHNNRNIARQAGIETIAIEILAIMHGQSFLGVIDAIEEAGREGEPVNLTRGGLSTLRRIEALVAEASMNIRRFSDGDFGVLELVEGRARLEADSQKAYLEMEERRIDGIRKDLASKEKNVRRQAETVAALKASLGVSLGSSGTAKIGQSKTSDISIWIPFAIFGVIVATVTVVAIVVNSNKK